MKDLLRVHCGTRSDGSPVYEEVVVEVIAPGRYRVVQSPGLVLGIAADDEFALSDELKAIVLSRGQNVCIQVYIKEIHADAEQAFLNRLAPLSGRLDGNLPQRLLVFTVPVCAGFPAIELAFNSVASDYPGIEWYYGNVYAEDGVTPLGWWEGNGQ